MLIAYGIDGASGYRFRFGVKGPEGKLLKMPPLTAPFSWPDRHTIKAIYPHESAAQDGEWCWHERKPDGV